MHHKYGVHGPRAWRFPGPGVKGPLGALLGARVLWFFVKTYFVQTVVKMYFYNVVLYTGLPLPSMYSSCI